MWWKRSWVDDPCVGNNLLQPFQKTFSEFLAPESAQVAIPQKREQQFFFENCFWRRCHADFLIRGQIENLFRIRNIRHIEQFKKPINRVAIFEIAKVRVSYFALHISHLSAEPLHFRTIRGRFFGDDDVDVFRISKDGTESIDHPSFVSNDVEPKSAVNLIHPGRQPDAARNTVEFRNTETMLCQQN